MPFKEETTILAEKSEKLAAALHRTWLEQVAVGCFGLLYIINPPLANALARDLKVQPELVSIAIPVVTLYLFATMGYQLVVYLRLRAVLTKLTSSQPNAKLLASDVSIYFWIAAWFSRDDFDIGKLPTGSVGPAAFMFLCSIGTYTGANGVAVYLLYKLSTAWPVGLKLLPAGVGLLLLFALSLQFATFVHREFRRGRALTWLSFLMTLIVFGLVAYLDPLSGVDLRH